MKEIIVIITFECVIIRFKYRYLARLITLMPLTALIVDGMMETIGGISTCIFLFLTKIR